MAEHPETRAQSTTADSYGRPPKDYRLPAATHLGTVRLQISDLVRSLAYYKDVLGLRVLRRDVRTAVLGTHGAGRVLVELHELRGAAPARAMAHLGLYHFALLLPDRASLGRFVRHLADKGVRAGAADHLVSEAFYLDDPDGLGIEVYANRPRDSWRRVDREVMMAADPIDAASLLRAAGDVRWSGMPGGAVVGHVHLHVGDLAQAAAFYSDALGFDRMVWSYPGALFLAAGGYHHHLGTNTWAGRGAMPPATDDARLLEWTIVVPDDAHVAAAGQNLAAAGYDVEHVSATELVTSDPWGTRLRLGTFQKT